MTDPIALTFPLTDPVLGTVQLAAWLYPPDSCSPWAPARWSLWLPGATYSGRGYFDPALSADGPTHSYSMARFLAQAGIGVITLDHVGTGQSACAASGLLLTRERYAALYVPLMHLLRERLLAGTLCPQVEAIAQQRLWLLGGGHSMGGYLLTAVQAAGAPFDAIALLGWTPAGVQRWDAALRELLPPFQEQFARAQESSLLLDRRPLRPFFYGEPALVPLPVIEEDEAAAVRVPVGLLQAGALLSEQPDPLAAEMRCPLYLCLAHKDLAADPSEQQRSFVGCSDYTCLLLPGAAHCANFAPTRRLLWEHLAAWTAAQAELHTAPRAGRGRQFVPKGGLDAAGE